MTSRPRRSLHQRTLLLLPLLLLLAAPLTATSYVMMKDGDLADQAPLIAQVRVDSVQAAPAQGPVRTDYLVTLERVIKGNPAGSSLVVRVPGGVREDGFGLKIWGAPEFQEGERALLFLHEHADGTYGILHLFLGAFHADETHGQTVVLRNLTEASEVRRLPGGAAAPATGEDRPRDLERFAAWLADRALGVERKADYFANLSPGALQSLGEKFSFFTSGNLYLRWFDFDNGGSVAWFANAAGQPGLAGGGFAEFQRALAVWTDEPVTPIRYVYAGTTGATTGLTSFDGTNAILFNDPNKEIDGTFDCATGGTLAVGGPFFNRNTTGVFNGETFVRIAGADIVVNDGLECFVTSRGAKSIEEMMAHELGHTLGLRHACGDANSGSCTNSLNLNKNDALMRATVHGDNRGARLSVDDAAGIRRLYADNDAGDAPCRSSDTALCLGNGRYRAELSWVNQFDGSTGVGRAVPATDISGYFSFGDPDNLELLVKVLDFGSAIKVFFGELTNLKFTLTVTDTQTHQFKTYGNTTGDCGGIDQSFFNGASVAGGLTSDGGFDTLETATAGASGTCRSDSTTLCLLDSRFAVKVGWRNPGNNTSGQGGPNQLSEFVGTFFFTEPSNVELMTKIIPFPDRFVFFYGALSDLVYSIQVTDTASGRTKSYQSTPGQLCGGLDNKAF